jgi:hypothetical protein
MPGYDPGNVTPRTQNYTVSIERELFRDTALKVSYLGAQAHHLLVLESANPGNPSLCLSLSRPDFAGFTFQKTTGNSSYNALEVSLRHSSRRGDLLIGYTYGKSIDQSSSLAEAVNPFNNALSRAISGFDLKHNFVASSNWTLPHRWMLSTIVRFSSGLPVTLFNDTDTSLAGTIPNGINSDGVDTPDVAPGKLSVNTNPRNGRPAFNTSLFALPAAGGMGTASRRFFYGAGMCNFDSRCTRRFFSQIRAAWSFAWKLSTPSTTHNSSAQRRSTATSPARASAKSSVSARRE